MSNISVKEAILGILSKSFSAGEAFNNVHPDDVDNLAKALAYVLKKNLVVSKEMDKGENCSEMLKTDKNGQWSMTKMEELTKPPRSEAQRKAMWAAASGHSNQGIPESVGKEYAEADPGGKLPARKKDMEKEEKEYKRVKTQMDSDTYDEPEKHNPDLAAPGKDGGGKLRKSWTDNAQWSLEKAIKPGPALDYGKMNPKKNYAEMEAKAPVIDYGGNRMASPKSYAGAAEHAAGVRAKLDAEAKEPAMDTIARRQKMNKEDGVNSEPEASPADRSKMTAKNEGTNLNVANPPDPASRSMSARREKDTQKGANFQAGGGTGGMPGACKSESTEKSGQVSGTDTMSPVYCSEQDPQPGEADHEAEEKKKAKEIKDEAEGLLDMHKEEDASLKNGELVQTKIKSEGDRSVKAVRKFPAG